MVFLQWAGVAKRVVNAVRAFVWVGREYIFQIERLHFRQNLLKLFNVARCRQRNFVRPVVLVGMNPQPRDGIAHFRKRKVLGVELVSETVINCANGMFAFRKDLVFRVQNIDAPQQCVFLGIDHHPRDDGLAGGIRSLINCRMCRLSNALRRLMIGGLIRRVPINIVEIDGTRAKDEVINLGDHQV